MKSFYDKIKEFFGCLAGERAVILNERAREALRQINHEIGMNGLEARQNRINLLKSRASQYSWEQGIEESIEARKYEDKLYNLFI